MSTGIEAESGQVKDGAARGGAPVPEPTRETPVVTVFAMQLAGIASRAELSDPNGLRAEAVRELREFCGPHTGVAAAVDFVYEHVQRLRSPRDKQQLAELSAWRWLAVELAAIS